MGCISSKFITKSLSFREDLSHRKRGANGLTMVDELFTSDHENGTSSDLVLSPKKSVESKNEETINTWELMAGLEEQAEQKQDVIVPSLDLPSSKVVDFDKLKRSKSFEMSTLAAPFGFNEHQGNKGVGRSRSFHTVEEYDAMMMERIMLSHNDEYDQYLNQYEKNKAYISELDIKEVIPNLSSCNINKDVVQETSTCGTGFKRKALAKGLESLQIPSAAEFRKTGSLKDWLQNGGNFSYPGEYVTPKFGNYNKPKSKLSEESRDDSIFNPELVAAFEEFLQQLEVEEDCILEQIEGNCNEITAT